MNHPHRSNRWKMTPDELLDAIAILTDSNQSEFARMIGVDGRTVRRWIAGDARIPKPIQILISSLQAILPEQRQQLNMISNERNR